MILNTVEGVADAMQMMLNSDIRLSLDGISAGTVINIYTNRTINSSTN